MLYFTENELVGPEQHSFLVSPGNFSILKLLWNYHQEFIKASGGWPIRRFHILKYCKSENKRFIVICFFARLLK